MTDLARIGFSADTAPLKAAGSDLDQFDQFKDFDQFKEKAKSLNDEFAKTENSSDYHTTIKEICDLRWGREHGRKRRNAIFNLATKSRYNRA